MDALTSMSTVAGYKAVISAANRLPKFLPMLGTAVGMVQPAQVVIGAGVAGCRPLHREALGAVTKAVMYGRMRQNRPRAWEPGLLSSPFQAN